MNHKTGKNYYLGTRYPGVYFTQREVDCLLYLLDGHTINSAAAKLKLSPRTVEFYVKNMRMKLGMQTKSALLQKIREIKFITNIEAYPPNRALLAVSKSEADQA